MSEWLLYVLPPLIGAGIGALTNDVAIRMLFRPYREWRIAGRRLPLTPGLIPRQRRAIAAGIADTFVTHVLDGEQITQALLNDSVRARIRERVAGMLDQLGGMLQINEGMLNMAKGMAGDRLLAELEGVAREAGGDGDLVRERIRERIDALDVERLEELVLGFSRQQFRHITWFGALLGFLIGVVQVLLIQVLPIFI